MERGSQFRQRDNWLNDPLIGVTNPIMSNPYIPGAFGPISPPFLSLVTQLTGSLTNALAAVPTVTLNTPFIVETNIAGDARWQLQAGTAATAAGIQRPNDYNATTNAKIWVQVS